MFQPFLLAVVEARPLHAMFGMWNWSVHVPHTMSLLHSRAERRCGQKDNDANNGLEVRFPFPCPQWERRTPFASAADNHDATQTQ